MAVFPALGKLRLEGYGEQPESAVLRTEMESGPPKQAQVRSRVMVTRPVTMQYNAADYGSFKTWFRDDIARGADWFDWTDPVDGVIKQARIAGGEYSAVPFTESQGGPLLWDVSFQLETWEA